VLVLVLIARSGPSTPTAAVSTTTSDSPSTSPTPSTTPSETPSATPSDTPTPTPTPTPTQAPPPAAPTLSGVAAATSPVCGTDPTATFSISYSSTHATSISIVSSGADGYQASATAPSGTFPNVVYTCGSPEPTTTYTVTATGPGGTATFALQVTASG